MSPLWSLLAQETTNWWGVLGLFIASAAAVLTAWLAIRRQQEDNDIRAIKAEVAHNRRELVKTNRDNVILKKAYAKALALLTLYKEAAEECMIEADEFGIIREWDAGAAIIFGYSPDDVIGVMTISDLLPPENRKEHEERASSVMCRHLPPRATPVVCEAICKYDRRFQVEVKLGKPYQHQKVGDASGSTTWRYPAKIKKLRLPSKEAIVSNLEDPGKTDDGVLPT